MHPQGEVADLYLRRVDRDLQRALEFQLIRIRQVWLKRVRYNAVPGEILPRQILQPILDA